MPCSNDDVLSICFCVSDNIRLENADKAPKRSRPSAIQFQVELLLICLGFVVLHDKKEEAAAQREGKVRRRDWKDKNKNVGAAPNQALLLVDLR